jgi:hypothetical protein
MGFVFVSRQFIVTSLSAVNSAVQATAFFTHFFRQPTASAYYAVRKRIAT